VTIEVEHDWQKHYSLKLGDIFVEAGAYMGRYALIASPQVGDKGRVILIEPDPANFALLEQTVKNLSNVILVKKAVWNQKGQKAFIVNTLSPLVRHVWGVYAPEYATDGLPQTVIADVDTVDNILSDLGMSKVDLFASDVEGAETQMLEGMDKTLSQKGILHLAITAYHQIGAAETIRRMLQEKGYKEIRYENPPSGGIIYAQSEV
jgi:FkbM family methyltransferase